MCSSLRLLEWLVLRAEKGVGREDSLSIDTAMLSARGTRSRRSYRGSGALRRAMMLQLLRSRALESMLGHHHKVARGLERGEERTRVKGGEVKVVGMAEIRGRKKGMVDGGANLSTSLEV